MKDYQVKGGVSSKLVLLGKGFRIKRGKGDKRPLSLFWRRPKK